MDARVLSSRVGAVVTVTVNRTKALNALDPDTLHALGAAFDDVAADADIRALVVTGVGDRAFVAGADIAAMKTMSPDAGREYCRLGHAVFARLEALPIPVVAAVNGAALGGGLELALACDLRIAAIEAKLGLPEARLGLIPGAGGTQRLTRLCGRPAAQRLILGAEVIDGATGRDLGVVQWAVPRAELPARAAELARRVAELPLGALAASKACIAAAGEPGTGGYSLELEATRRLLTEPETRRRVEAFLAGAPS
jgi:enoyl-CoA hydratase/carnithine racemase